MMKKIPQLSINVANLLLNPQSSLIVSDWWLCCKITPPNYTAKVHRPFGRMQQMFTGSFILLTTDENKHFCYDKIIKLICITKTLSTHLWYGMVMCDNGFFKTNHTDLSDYVRNYLNYQSLPNLPNFQSFHQIFFQPYAKTCPAHQ